MPNSSGWTVSRLGVVVGVVALLVAVMVWSRPSSDPAPAGTPSPGRGTPEGFAGANREAMVAPPEATLFREVLSATNAAVRDGLWYLLDLRGAQVHRLDPATGSVRTFGRRGGGPGEFRGLPSGIVVHGDSIMVTDRMALRIFGPEGQHYADRVLRFNPICWVRNATNGSNGSRYRN